MIIYSIAAGGTNLGRPPVHGRHHSGPAVGALAHHPRPHHCLSQRFPEGRGHPAAQALKIAVDAIWGMVTIAIILGGILSGIFTPTEAGAGRGRLRVFVTMFVYRTSSGAELPKLVGRVVRTVGMVMIMIGFSIAFGYMMAIMRVPAIATQFFIDISSDKYMFLLWINILAAARHVMDLAPMLLICTPIFLPVIKTFGIDPVHFGIIMILNLGIGLLTPPVGPTMVVGCAIGKVSMEAVSRSILIFYVPMIIVLLLVTYIPALTLWLPSVGAGEIGETAIVDGKFACAGIAGAGVSHWATPLIPLPLVFLVVGCFLDAIPAIVIVGTVLEPLARSVDLHPVQFAIISIVSLAFGLVTTALRPLPDDLVRRGGRAPALRVKGHDHHADTHDCCADGAMHLA